MPLSARTAQALNVFHSGESLGTLSFGVSAEQPTRRRPGSATKRLAPSGGGLHGSLSGIR